MKNVDEIDYRFLRSGLDTNTSFNRFAKKLKCCSNDREMEPKEKVRKAEHLVTLKQIRTQRKKRI